MSMMRNPVPGHRVCSLDDDDDDGLSLFHLARSVISVLFARAIVQCRGCLPGSWLPRCREVAHLSSDAQLALGLQQPYAMPFRRPAFVSLSRGDVFLSFGICIGCLASGK